ncbi:hypothetical protein QNH98_11535 [Myroides sp. mNGS23_01]|nr:hypothetical protein [Myroides sp. mNGS23_01]WHT37789.1 hypothetical protein QNH98_11535 [Myroides sp. mNGS23_01]
MIPKKIHLCWFGKGVYPLKMMQCLASIAKYLPQYEVTIWTEENFDIASYRFAHEAYREKNMRLSLMSVEYMC